MAITSIGDGFIEIIGIGSSMIGTLSRALNITGNVTASNSASVLLPAVDKVKFNNIPLSTTLAERVLKSEFNTSNDARVLNSEFTASNNARVLTSEFTASNNARVLTSEFTASNNARVLNSEFTASNNARVLNSEFTASNNVRVLKSEFTASNNVRVLTSEFTASNNARVLTSEFTASNNATVTALALKAPTSNSALTGSTTAVTLSVTSNITAGGTLTASNLLILGDTTVLNTTIKATEQLSVSNSGTMPALIVTQHGAQNIAEFYDENSIMLMLANGGNVGIGSEFPSQKLDVLGNIKATGATFTGTINLPADANYTGTTLSDALGGKANGNSTTVKIGLNAGTTAQGTNAIAIGANSGTSSQPNNSIIINASGNSLNATATNSCIINPIRNSDVSATPGNRRLLTYDTGTSEMCASTVTQVEALFTGKASLSGATFTGPVTLPDGTSSTSTKLGTSFLTTLLDGKASLSGANFTGNVGIGTAVPTEKLDVLGNIKASGMLNINVGIGGSSTTLTGPFIKQNPWTGPNTVHTISGFYVSENSSGNVLINVKLPSSVDTTAKNGSANISFIKTVGSSPELFGISLHASKNLTTFNIEGVGDNIQVTTDAGCYICWTSTGAF